MIADSISPEGIRLPSMELRYPRFIHSELMTHRVMSRNARSSRAVPVPKMLQEIMDDPVIPIHWGAAQKGMQAYEECNEVVYLNIPEAHLDFNTPVLDWNQKGLSRENAWLRLRDQAVETARSFHEAGYHKQVINRLLEPWMHIDTLVTATQWSNFLALRDHEMAEPHIQELSRQIRECLDSSTPQLLQHGQWHLPYVTKEEFAGPLFDRAASQSLNLWELACKISVARCARISYEPFDGDPSYEAELRRYDLLVGSHPLHASPAEHQATPDVFDRMPLLGADGKSVDIGWMKPRLHGNLEGWIQYRKTLPGECQ
jgi:hypothetical protein